ncbi:MAG: hypothetical protein ACFBZ8_01260 [Opitutales bacterium]
MYVILDNETVDFEGPAPASPRACFDLLNGHLGERGRCLLRFEADGEDILGQAQPRFPETAREVRACSTSQASLLAQFARNQLKPLQSLAALTPQLQDEFLTQPWSLMRQKLPAFSAAIQPALELLGPLAQYRESSGQATVASLQTAFQQGLEAMAESAEAESPAEISEALADAIAPSLQLLQALLDQQILPALEAEADV